MASRICEVKIVASQWRVKFLYDIIIEWVIDWWKIKVKLYTRKCKYRSSYSWSLYWMEPNGHRDITPHRRSPREWVGSWTGTGASQDAVEKRKYSSPYWFIQRWIMFHLHELCSMEWIGNLAVNCEFIKDLEGDCWVLSENVVFYIWLDRSKLLKALFSIDSCSVCI